MDYMLFNKLELQREFYSFSFHIVVSVYSRTYKSERYKLVLLSKQGAVIVYVLAYSIC